MTNVVAYHLDVRTIALLETDRMYWIGVYDRELSQLKGQPQYRWVAGDYNDKVDALHRLDSFDVDQFE
jgi:hypothetical protein